LFSPPFLQVLLCEKAEDRPKAVLDV